MKNGHFSIILLIIMCLCGCTANTEKQIATSKQLNNMKLYIKTSAASAEDKLEDADNEENKYPEFFSGYYINHDEQMVICLTKDSQEIRKIFEDILNDEELQFEKATYSLNELDNAMEYMRSRLREMKDDNSKYTEEEWALISSIVAYGIDDERNRVVVEIYELNAEKESNFKRLFPDISDFYELVNKEGKAVAV